MESESNGALSAAQMIDIVGFEGHIGQQKPGGLHLWGNRETMNMNTMVLTNVKQSPYFKHELIHMKTFHEVVDAIYYKVTHLEPWERGSRRTAGLSGASGGGLQVRGVGAGGIVSTAYCLLYKLFTLRISRKQLQALLDHPDSPYIRGIGFMYIRYCLDPKDYWDWFSPYLDDTEEIDAKAGGGGTVTLGEMLRQMLTQLDWYGTLFPRIPVPIEKDLRAKLQELQKAATTAASSAAPTEEDATRRSEGSERRHGRRDSKDRSRSRSRSRGERTTSSLSHAHTHQKQRHHSGEGRGSAGGGGGRHRRSRSRDRDRDCDRDRDRDRHRDRGDRDRDRGDRDEKHRHHHRHHSRDKDGKDRRGR